jgi:hypothetical protein
MELPLQRNKSQLNDLKFTGRYVSLKYRIYLYNITRDEKIKQITTQYTS